MRRFVSAALADAGTFVLDGDEGAHLVRVLRARPGEEVLVFDGRGREARCRIEATTRDAATLLVIAPTVPPRARRDVAVATAVPRGERMEWLVEKCVEAGASRIVAVAFSRSVRDRCSANVLRRWNRSALEASKQCGRADVPEVTEPMELADALRALSDRVLCAAVPGTAAPLDAVLGGDAARVGLVIGAEGGFEPHELDAIGAAGARPFGLGPRILRIETAAAIATHLAAR